MRANSSPIDAVIFTAGQQLLDMLQSRAEHAVSVGHGSAPWSALGLLRCSTTLAGRPFLCYLEFMNKSIRDNTKKRGRPKTTGKGTLIGVRLLPAPMQQLDQWIASQPDTPSRPEALRRLMDLGLKAKSK